MRTTLVVHYAAPFGQHLEVVHDDGVTPMEWSDGDWWRADLDETLTDYRYRVVYGSEVVDVETGPHRRLAPVTAPTTVVDRYRMPDATRAARQSAFFGRAVAARHPQGQAPPTGRITFRLLEPGVPPGMVPAIVGAVGAMGEWDVGRAIPMVPAPFPWWQAAAEVDDATDYKYVLLDGDGQLVRWEDGADRMLPRLDGRVRVADDDFRGLPGFRGAGVAIPVFALRSPEDIGVGQFTDLVPFAEWAAETGLSVIQLLPVNDTVIEHSWQDSYPYNPTSVQALHPLYVDVAAIDDAGIDDQIAAAQARFEGAVEIDYPAVMESKMGLLREAYANLDVALAADEEFTSFVDDEWDWLGPFSLWSVLRDRHGTADFTAWSDEAEYDPDLLDRASDPASKDYDDLRFHWFVQFHLRRQLTAAADHARSLGVALKGDLPIGVAPESVEVWTQPELFHVGAQTGAPPDAFSVLGQNWKFPTYNWDRMAEDGYRWWQERFRALAAYVDVYRIDHVLGFFRIWEVPPHSDDGLLGRFRPSLPLSAADIEGALGDVDLDGLIRPLADAEFLERKFGPDATRIRARYLTGSDDQLRLVPEMETQRQILDAFGLVDAGDADAEVRGLLDIATEVLLIEVDGGYQPRIEWQATRHYHHLDHDSRVRFDALAIDFFHHRHRDLWREQGATTLPAITGATDLLTCGEDLGMVPDFVPALMNEMGLLSLEIERMPKRLGAWRAVPGEAPYLSVVSPGTHDTKPLRMWWEDDREAAQRMWNEALGRAGDAPDELAPDVAEHLVRAQLASPAMLAIVPIADLFAIDGELRRDDHEAEWINDPSNRHNKWRYRMHMTIDELRSADRFNSWVTWMIEQASR